MPRARRSQQTPEVLSPSSPVENPNDVQPAQPSDSGDAIPGSFAFFQALKRLDWTHHTAHVYRQQPKVKNAGEIASIEKFSYAFDESDIKKTHGGGKYLVILKDDTAPEDVAPKRCSFWIEGEPVFQPGQTFVDGRPAVSASAPNPNPGTSTGGMDPISSIKEIVKAILAETGRGTTPDQAIQMVFQTMQQANTMSLDIVKNSVINGNNSSMTGNPLMDKLLTAAVERMTNPQSGSRIEEILLAKLVKDLTEEKEEPEPSSQLKEITQTLAQLADREKRGGRGPNWQELIVDIGGKLFENAPALIDRVRAFTAENFDRELQLRRLAANPNVAPPPAPTPQILQPSAPAPQAQPVESIESKREAEAIDFIADTFAAGSDGELASILVARRYSDVVVRLEPLLVNQDGTVNIEMARTALLNLPALAEFAKSEDEKTRKEFEQFFVDFMENVFAREPESESVGA